MAVTDCISQENDRNDTFDICKLLTFQIQTIQLNLILFFLFLDQVKPSTFHRSITWSERVTTSYFLTCGIWATQRSTIRSVKMSPS